MHFTTPLLIPLLATLIVASPLPSTSDTLPKRQSFAWFDEVVENCQTNGACAKEKRQDTTNTVQTVEDLVEADNAKFGGKRVKRDDGPVQNFALLDAVAADCEAYNACVQKRDAAPDAAPVADEELVGYLREAARRDVTFLDAGKRNSLPVGHGEVVKADALKVREEIGERRWVDDEKDVLDAI